MSSESLTDLEGWTILQDPGSSEEARREAFRRFLLVRLQRRNCTFTEFALACAQASARRITASLKVSSDVIDPELISQEALMSLYLKAPHIQDPVSWIRGTIKNLTLSEARTHFEWLNASKLPDELPAPTEEQTPPPSPAQRRLHSALTEVLESQPPSLRSVAELLARGRASHEIAEELGISPAATRKRIERLRKRVREEMRKRGFGR